MIDLDAGGKIVGIDIQHASEIMDLGTLEAESLPAVVTQASHNPIRQSGG
ncbi:MAG: DUF2283 domain-containing protein [Candidatus Sulfotelmatobacter sp.]